jgi:hypothetical protein
MWCSGAYKVVVMVVVEHSQNMRQGKGVCTKKHETKLSWFSFGLHLGSKRWSGALWGYSSLSSVAVTWSTVNWL